MTETQVGEIHLKDGSMGHELSNAGTIWKLEKDNKWIHRAFRRHIVLQTP